MIFLDKTHQQLQCCLSVKAIFQESERIQKRYASFLCHYVKKTLTKAVSTKANDFVMATIYKLTRLCDRDCVFRSYDVIQSEANKHPFLNDANFRIFNFCTTEVKERTQS